MVTRKGRHSGSNPLGQGLIAQIGPPLPGRDAHLDWILSRVEPHGTIPDVHQRTNVTSLQPIDPDGFDNRFRRLWQFYLAYCEAGFRAGATDVYQFLLEKPRA